MTRRAKGEGSIYQRHDHESCPSVVDGERADHRCRGRWVATISYPNDNARRDRKVIYGRTKTEVILKRKEAERKAPAKRIKVDKVHTVETWMNEWLENIAAQPPKAIKNSTRKSHRSKIDQYIVPVIGSHRLDRLEAKHIRRLYAQMQMDCPRPTPARDKGGAFVLGDDGLPVKTCAHSPSHGLSESTTRQTHAILSRALKVAKRESLIETVETENVDAPGTATRERDRLTVAQATLVLIATKDDPHASRWYAAIQMGLRQGEALGLPWGLVNFEANTITIARTIEADGAFGTPKSDAGNRTIVMFPEFRAHLTVHWAAYLARCKDQGVEPDPMACVWTQANGKPFGTKTDYNRWQALLAKAKMPKVSLHSARQTCASMLEELGWPERVAAEFLGHADVKQTYKYQRGHSLDSQRRAMGQIEP